MKKLLVIIFCLLVLVSCDKKEEETNIEVDMDGYAIITLDTRGGVPYSWECEIEDESIIEYFTDEYVSESDLDGGPVQNIYYYKGLREGETIVNCSYKSITDENDISKSQKFNVIVNDKLEAKIGE